MKRSRELLIRVADALADLVRQRGTAPEELKAESEAQEGGAFEQAVTKVGLSLERWRSAMGLSRFLSSAGRDQVVALGETVALGARLDPPLRWLARGVRFFVDEVAVGEAEQLGAESVMLSFRVTKVGCHRVEFEVLGRGGVVLGARDAHPATRLAVLDDAPVVAVDARLLVGDPTVEPAVPAPQTLAVVAAVRRLHAVGFVTCWVDFVDLDRVETVRAALAIHGLSDAAVLSHRRSELEFDPLGVDFRAMVRTTTLRQIRAAGVPLGLLLWGDDATAALPVSEEIECVGPAELTSFVDDQRALERLRARAARFVAAREGASSRVSFRLDQATRSVALEGNACRVELDNHAARDAVLGALERARRSIHLQCYILKPSLFTEQLEARLIERARAGVAVRLLVDALYSTEQVLGLSNPILRALASEPNIEVAAADPIAGHAHVEALRLKQRDHRKLVIVDGELAFVSGRNVGDEYYTGFDEVPITDRTLHERIPWFDAHVEVRGPLVAEVARAFAVAWGRARGRDLTDEECVSTTAAPAGPSRARLVQHEGITDASGMAAYEAIIDAAESHLYLVNDFPLTITLSEALRRARARGVRVTLLTGSALARRGDGTFFKGPIYRELFEYMSKRRFEPLMRVGVEVLEYSPPPSRFVVCRGGRVRPYVHAKVVTADGVVASVGSANLDVTASYWEREANVIIEDPAFVAELEGRIAAMVEGSFRIDLDSDYWKGEAPQREIVDRLWPEILYS